MKSIITHTYTKKFNIALLLFLIGIMPYYTHAQTMATNPIIWADVPDVSIVRVADTYYMSSTTMHMSPGVPIMKSKDLVNWELVSYCYASFDNTDSYNLNNGKNDYGHGSWASSIRYHKGIYYVTTFANTGKTYIYKTANIEAGPWTVSIINSSYHDCNLFFDDDDRAYLIYGQGDIKIIELTADASAVKAGGVNKTIITNAASIAGTIGLNAEGSQVIKRNGYYYINFICWPSGGMRTQLLYRSSTLTGTYEGRVILKDQGVAQGSFIETPAGKWYAYLFRDFGSVGRIPYLVPMTWGTDNWPTLSAVPTTLDIPKGTGGLHNLVATDEFTTSTPLKLAWQWNHNPNAAYWSLSQKSGYMRLTNERNDPNVLMTTNTLTQRTFGPTSTAYTAIDVSGMKDGDYVGIVALQKIYGCIGVKMNGTSKNIVMITGDDVTGTPIETAGPSLTQNTIYVRIDMDFQNRTDKANFYYSLNGTTWTKLGNTVQMSYTIPHFMGYRFGLFTYATKSAGGYADFDFYRVGSSITNIYAESTSIATAISLSTPTTNQTYTALATVSIAATATITGGTISKVEFYNGTTKLGEDATSPYTYSWTNVAAGTYSITAVATDNTSATTTSTAVSIKVSAPKAPYGGTAHPIPGKIEFEHFDEGGNGVGYLDNTPGSAVTPIVNFRTTEDVDIENCTDTGTGYNIGYATAGEWLEYSVNVATAGTYTITLRAACDGDRTVSIQAKGVTIANNVAIPSTGGWQIWQDVVIPNVTLTAGAQVIRVTIGATDYVNLNYMTFESVVKPIQLQAGWNMIGCPLQGTTNIQQALSSIWSQVETVKDQDAFWDSRNISALNSLSNVIWGKGYLIKVKANCTLDWIVK